MNGFEINIFSWFKTKIKKNIASPQDIVNFLTWRDKLGKTYSRADDCVARSGAKSPCSCPKSLAAGTIDNNIGKLRSILETLAEALHGTAS